jgi:alanyl-tRNA synthetase
MLGNWSFGDYFKKEAISWAWELIVERSKFPRAAFTPPFISPTRKGDPAERDEESWEIWAEKFRSVGLDPDIHIVNGNKKDNFWMMADTGPCGPCTEIHIDLTPGPHRADEERQTCRREARQWQRRELHRDLEQRLHPIQRVVTRYEDRTARWQRLLPSCRRVCI